MRRIILCMAVALLLPGRQQQPPVSTTTLTQAEYWTAPNGATVSKWFDEDGIEILYPADVLEGDWGSGIGIGFTYEQFEDILHPWAIPEYRPENVNELEANVRAK